MHQEYDQLQAGFVVLGDSRGNAGVSARRILEAELLLVELAAQQLRERIVGRFGGPGLDNGLRFAVAELADVPGGERVPGEPGRLAPFGDADTQRPRDRIGVVASRLQQQALEGQPVVVAVESPVMFEGLFGPRPTLRHAVDAGRQKHHFAALGIDALAKSEVLAGRGHPAFRSGSPPFVEVFAELVVAPPDVTRDQQGEGDEDQQSHPPPPANDNAQPRIGELGVGQAGSG